MAKKVAIVTGAGRGIGLGIALKLAKELDMNIVIVDVDEVSMADAVKQVKATGKDAIAVKCDVSKPADVQNMVAKSFEFGDVDVIVNNAGITKDAMLLKMTEAEYDLVMNINLKGIFLIPGGFVQSGLTLPRSWQKRRRRRSHLHLQERK